MNERPERKPKDSHARGHTKTPKNRLHEKRSLKLILLFRKVKPDAENHGNERQTTPPQRRERPKLLSGVNESGPN